jgi:serine/threonine protein kinase
MALNATTGEMIAVKQVEIPRTASDKNDSRQVTVVEALKLESETLKDLDHTNIVQYLGFEETPNFLSMYVASFLWRSLLIFAKVSWSMFLVAPWEVACANMVVSKKPLPSISQSKSSPG